MITALVFFWGFVGSLGVEIVNLTRAHDQSRIPLRYKKWGFWIVRLLLALVAGLVAIAFEAEKPLHALSLGAATPIIIRWLECGRQHPISFPLPGSSASSADLRREIPYRQKTFNRTEKEN